MNEKPLSRELTLTVKNQSYPIHFPKVSQVFDVESEKALLSRGQYGAILEAGTMDSSLVIALINTVATFKVLCPKLIEDMRISIMDLDLQDAMEIVQIYSKQYFPWYKEWREKMASLAGLE